MDYISSLRKKVGHDPLILIGSTLLALNKKSELLMVRRTDNQCWGVPGGMMEPGETLEQTAIRETKEEIGIQLDYLKLFGVYSGPELFYVYPNGDQVFNVSIVYICREISGEIQINKEEHNDFRFFPLTNLPDNISPPIVPIIHDLVNQYNQK